jgi:Uncharacterized protein conserved in bacteria
MSEMRYVWYFADGDRPAPGDGPHTAHEALMILNTSLSDAHLELDLFWTDRPPTRGIALAVGAERVSCIRLDRPDEIGGICIPIRTQYALRLRADQPVVVQYGRLETAAANYALMSSSGYHVGGGTAQELSQAVGGAESR